MKKYILVLIFLPSLIFAQSDSLKDLLNYYPLQNGNYWEYKIIGQPIPYPPDTLAYSIEVKGDTVLNNNHTYKILTYQNIFPKNNSYNKYERIDSATGCVFRYYEDTSLVNNEFKIDSLFAEPGDEINSSVSFRRSGYYKTTCKSKEIDTVFGVATEVKTFFVVSNIPTGEYRLAKGFGYYGGHTCELSCGDGALVYARINGKEYGKKIITGVAEQKVNPMSFSVLQNYPNPFNPSTNIIFEIPKTGVVTIRIFDALGKEINSIAKNYSNSGIYRIEFNGSKYSSGIYIYQIEFNKKSISKKMLLLK